MKTKRVKFLVGVASLSWGKGDAGEVREVPADVAKGLIAAGSAVLAPIEKKKRREHWETPEDLVSGMMETPEGV